MPNTTPNSKSKPPKPRAASVPTASAYATNASGAAANAPSRASRAKAKRKPRRRKARSSCQPSRSGRVSRTAPAAPGKRMRFGDALRARGMDELALAHRMIGISDTLAKDTSTEGAGNREKLHLELLKEFAKHLDPPRPANAPGIFGSAFSGAALGSGSGEPPVIVQLVHNVPRPDRIVPPVDNSSHAVTTTPEGAAPFAL